jgi:uncharacterized membrane protein
MSHLILSLDPTHRILAQVSDVTTSHPWRWLRAGWQDLRRAPAASIGYGALFAIASYLITLWVVVHPSFYLLVPTLFGFFLVAPALAVGTYEISRRIERGETPHLGQAIAAVFTRGVRVTTVGALMALVLLAWLTAAGVILGGLGTALEPSLASAVGILSSPGAMPALLAGTVVGALFAMLVFVLSAVSVPMLLDRDDVGILDAMQTSLTACLYNPWPMLVWATLIAVCILAGFLTLYVGLAIGFPVIGHATWHAYRDLVQR